MNLKILAQHHALISAGDHDYLPNDPIEASQFEPHQWVLDALKDAYNAGKQSVNTPEVANSIVQAILDDLGERNGIDQALDEVDDEVMGEMTDTLTGIIQQTIGAVK